MPVTGHVEYTNNDALRTKGLEFELAGKTRRGLQGKASYTLQNSEDPYNSIVTNSPHQLAKVNFAVPFRAALFRWPRGAVHQPSQHYFRARIGRLWNPECHPAGAAHRQTVRHLGKHRQPPRQTLRRLRRPGISRSVHPAGWAKLSHRPDVPDVFQMNAKRFDGSILTAARRSD